MNESSRERSPSTSKYFITYNEFVHLCNELARHVRASKEHFDYIFGVMRGGLIPAVYLSHILDIPMLGSMCNRSDKQKFLIVEDVIDTSRTLKLIKQHFDTRDHDVIVSLIGKSWNTIKADYTAKWDDRWVTWPWENS